MSRFLQNESPPPPASTFIMGCSSDKLTLGQSLLYTGGVRRFLKNRTVTFSKKNLGLMFGILQGVKRGAAPAPDSFISKAYIDHKKLLTTAKTVNLIHLDETIHYHTRLFKDAPNVDVRIYEASNSASYESKRSSGGARAFLRNQALLGIRSREPPCETGCSNKPAVGLENIFERSSLHDSCLMEMGERRPGDVWTVKCNPMYESPLFIPTPGRYLQGEDDLVEELEWKYRIDPPMSESYSETQENEFLTESECNARLDLDPLRTQDKFCDEDLQISQSIAFGVAKALGDQPANRVEPGYPLRKLSVVVCAVPKALGIRLITKTESEPSHYARFAQKGMWAFLHDLPQFRLIGDPVETTDILDLLRREKECDIVFDDPEWNSGDFSNATDRVKMAYTKESFETWLIKQSLSDDQENALRSVLYEQVLNYPKQEDPVIAAQLLPATQVNGQLMGSILSFPILCALNLVGYWKALETWAGRKIPLRSLPVLINGDDILFRCDKRLYGLWKAEVNEIGFELSVGKNYLHRSFFTINSIAFYHDETRGSVEKLGFLNVGLLTGQERVTGHNSKSLPIWDYYSKVMDGARDKLRCHRRFLHYNRKDIDELTNKGEYSLFVHQSLGGLGFPLYPEVAPTTRFTPFQRSFGKFLRNFNKQPYDGEYEKEKQFVGLVQPVRRVPMRPHPYHYARYSVRTSTTPQQESERDIFDPNVTLRHATMAYDIKPQEKDEVITIRPIDRRVLSGFRKQASHSLRPRSLREITTYNYKTVETFPDVEDMSSYCNDVREFWC